MPNTVVIDVAATFASMLLISVGVKNEFGTANPEINKTTGEKKYTAEIAVTPVPDGPIAPRAEVLSVTITGGDESAMLAIVPGSPVILDKLKMGISAPEKSDKGGIRGGRAWYNGLGLKAAQPAQAWSGRKSEAA